MSAIGTGYDQGCSSFSPDGKIFQVEYAQKAVDSCGTMIALRGKNGIVTAVDKLTVSMMYTEHNSARIWSANENVGLAVNGLYPDCFALKTYATKVAESHLKQYREPMPINKLVDEVAHYVFYHTLSNGLRPFGASMFFSTFDQKKGGRLFLVESSGLSTEFRGWAVGKNKQAAKAEIEKLKLEELDMQDLVREAARIILLVREEHREKTVQVEMGWIGEETNWKHERVPFIIAAEAEEWAEMKLDLEDMDD